jgi:putative FmdB family regulatory protein
MPLYEYQCEACSHRFERIQKFSDPPVDTCPSCGGKVRKLLSSPAIQFKGSGWYVTDYARQDKKGSSGGDKAASGGNETKTDSAAKTESSSSTGSSAASSSEKSSGPTTKSE